MTKIINSIKILLKHELVTGSFYIFIGGLFASFIAFLFNFYMARNLSYSDYGILASLISLFTLAVIPSQSLTSTIVRFASDFFAKEEYGLASIFYKKMLIFWFISGIIFFLIIALFSPQISTFLKIKTNLFVIIMAVSVGLTYMGIVNISFLQSLLKFKYMAFLYSVSSVIKIFLGVLLVVLGFSVGGALWAVASMALVGYILGFYPLKFLFRQKILKDVSINWKEILHYAMPTMIIVLSVTSLVTSDIILVKHYFSPTEAGLYGGISLIGKVIFYFTAPIPAVMFPLIVKRHTKKEDFRGLFHLSVVLVLIPSIAITAFYFIFPQFSINLFLGGKDYLKIVPFLGLFGILISIFSVLNVVVNFFLSVKKTVIVLPSLIAPVLQVLLISMFHSNFYQIITISIFSSSLLLIILLLYYSKQYGLYNTSK